MKLFTRLAVAAGIALVAGLVFLTNPGGRALALADVIEQVKQAKSVRFKASINVMLQDGNSQTVESTMVISGNRMRQEMPGVVQVMAQFTCGLVMRFVSQESDSGGSSPG